MGYGEFSSRVLGGFMRKLKAMAMMIIMSVLVGGSNGSGVRNHKRKERRPSIQNPYLVFSKIFESSFIGLGFLQVVKLVRKKV